MLAAIAVGTALNDRLIMSLDAPLSDYLPEGGGTQWHDYTARVAGAGSGGVVGAEETTDYLAFAGAGARDLAEISDAAGRTAVEALEAGPIEFQVT